MIIKNLSRKSNSGALFKYIFRYVSAPEKTKGKGNGRKGSEVVAKDWRAEWRKVGIYIPMTPQIARWLHAERVDGALFKDMKAKCPDGNYSEYIQKYLVPRDIPLPHIRNLGVVIAHNVRSGSVEGYIREFERNEAGRIHKRSNQTSIHHTIISFSNKDTEHISEEMLRDIARKYIELRGPNCKYVGTLHRDKEHLHLHIAQSATQINGKSARISKKDFEDVKVKLQAYQMDKYPQLVHSLPEHRKSKVIEKEKEGVKNFYKNERSSVKNDVLKCLETLKYASTPQLLEGLEKQGYTAYYRGGKLTGVEHEDGLKFRFSRLGVDIARLQQQDVEREKDAQAAKELTAIRKGHSRERNIEMGKEKETQIEHVTEKEQQKLQELETMRNTEREQEHEERDYGNAAVLDTGREIIESTEEPDYEEEGADDIGEDEETSFEEI